MDTSKLCFGCFNEHDGTGPCPHCGYDLATAKHPFVALPIGTILNGRYLTGRVLGVGGFGVTYLAFDMTLEISVAIKEFLPSGIALRESDRYTMTVSSPEEQPKFDSGVSKFLEEARLLAKLRDVPNIVSVQDYFRENNTAYFVMEYIEGVDLMKYTQSKGGKLSYNETLRLILPVIESLAHVHEHKLLHRDISPDNIVVMRNGTTRLLDFGAARLAVDSEKSKSIILKHGFAPEEQYRKHGNQGPWSDEYALAATMYLILTGVMPPDAIERVHEDTLVPPIALGVDIPQYANDALLKALSVHASGRFPDMSSFAAALTGQSVKSAAPAASFAGSSYAASSDVLPTGATGMDGKMVEGKTVAMEQDTGSSGYTPEKVLSPSILVNGQNQPSQQGVVPTYDNQINKPVPQKKSIWKRPLTYIIAGVIFLAGIGTAVGVYISQNYEFGEQTKKTSTRKTRITTKDTEPSVTEVIPDPSTTENGDIITYTDSARNFTITAAKDFNFTNKDGLFCYEKSDDTVAVYVDMLNGIDDLRLDSLNDFVAQSEQVLPAFVSEVLGFSDFEQTVDYLYIHTFSDRCTLEYSGYAIQNNQKKDLTLLVTERKDDKGIFITCGVMPLDDNGMYSGDDWSAIESVLMSFDENTTSSSGYTYYDEENMPSFLYKNSEVESVQPGKIGNDMDTLNLVLKDMPDQDNQIFVILLGDQDSISTACSATEQALASTYKFGGYKSVTPTVLTNMEMRIRNYTLTKIDDDGNPIECTACVINRNGEYYSVIAMCKGEENLERITLDFTLVVKSMLEHA